MAELSENAQVLLGLLPETGRITNQTGMKITGWDYDRLIQAKFELRDAGVVEIKQGWGGPFGRISTATPGTESSTYTGASIESELYGPLSAWVKTELVPDDFREGKDLFEVVISANKRPPSAGTWEVPDIVSLSLRKYPYVPTVEMVVVSFEVKKGNDAFNVYGVFEAVSHSKFAHKSYYCFEYADDNFEKHAGYQRVLQEATANGIGVIRCKFADISKSSIVVDVLLEPLLRQPETSTLNGLIDAFFDEEIKRKVIERTAYNLFW